MTAPEKFEVSIASLENTKDLSKITLAELVSAMQSQEQQRLMRRDNVVEGALPAKHHHVLLLHWKILRICQRLH